jgi:hypothetical protein
MTGITFDVATQGSTVSSTTLANPSVPSLTTAGPNEFLYYFIANRCLTGYSTVVSVTDTAGLTWTKRAGPHQYTINHGGTNVFNNVEIWTAPAPDKLSSDGITITFSASCDSNALLLAFGGEIDIFNPFDSDAGLPFLNTDHSGSATTPTVNVSTVAANTMLLSFSVANDDTHPTPIVGTGFTGFTQVGTQGVGNIETGGLVGQYAAKTSVQTSTPCADGYTTANWSIFADALVSKPPIVDIAGSQTNHAQSASTLVTTGVTPQAAGCVLVAGIHSEQTGVYHPVTGIASSNGLTWAKRTAKQWVDAGGVNNNFEIWWAAAPGTITSEVLTISFSGTVDACTSIVFSTFGPSLSSPWDTNGSLPALKTDVTGSNVAVTGPTYSTSNKGVALTFYADAQGPTSNGEPIPNNPWFVINGVDDASAPVNWSVQAASFKYLASPASSDAVVYAATPTLKDWGVITDALSLSTSPSGTWASTETPDTFAAIGFPGFPGVSGQFVVTENKDTFAATGYPAAVGTWHTTESPDTFSAFGRQPEQGTWHSTENPDVFAATGFGVGINGVWASTEAVDIFAAFGHSALSGVWASTEAADRFSALGAGVSRVSSRRQFFVT